MRPMAAPEHDAVQVLDHVVQQAVSMRASDIHIEPKRDGVRIRYRMDGVLKQMGVLPLEIAAPLASRIKVLARMDMTERRLPQDGQFTLESSTGTFTHLRCSTFPGIHGETVVLRVLLGAQLIAEDQLGLNPAEVQRLRGLARRSSGLVVVCGPTGSGKTSTLYAMLRMVNTKEQNVVTLEDPIEVEVPDITQGQTNVRQGFTFATGLRAILRQDPDVILVGEMRDAETAQIALQASLTGHLVLSTLHTANAVETIVRLVDLGVESWIVANSLLAIIAQRLVRVLCADCKLETEAELPFLGEGGEVLIAAGTSVWMGVGCDTCHHTGFRGRTGIYEMVEVDDDLRDMIKARSANKLYRDTLKKTGGLSLRASGAKRILDGTTTIEEVSRVT